MTHSKERENTIPHHNINLLRPWKYKEHRYGRWDGFSILYVKDLRILAYLANEKFLSNPNNQIYFNFLVLVSLPSPGQKIYLTHYVMNPLIPKYRRAGLLVPHQIDNLRISSHLVWSSYAVIIFLVLVKLERASRKSCRHMLIWEKKIINKKIAMDDENKKWIHRETEKQRRQEMGKLCTTLRSLLPLEYIKVSTYGQGFLFIFRVLLSFIMSSRIILKPS